MTTIESQIKWLFESFTSHTIQCSIDFKEGLSNILSIIAVLDINLFSPLVGIPAISFIDLFKLLT